MIELVLAPYENIVDPTTDNEGNKIQFKFDELDDSAKEAARDWFRDGNQDTGWWDHVYDDAVTVGALMGIEIGKYFSKTHGGKSITKPDISFSGFCSQGDGCCFSGHLRITNMADAVANIKGHAPQDETLSKLATEAERIYIFIQAYLLTCKLKDEEPTWVDPLTDVVKIKGDERWFRTRIDDDDIGGIFEDDLNSFVSDFADWIYARLEKENDYMNSDEYADEGIAAGEYLFDELGSII